MINIFVPILDGVINRHIPSKVVKFNKYKHMKSKWMTYGLFTKIKKRVELYRAVSMTNPGTNAYTAKQSELKNNLKEVRNLKRNSKANYCNLEFIK